MCQSSQDADEEFQDPGLRPRGAVFWCKARSRPPESGRRFVQTRPRPRAYGMVSDVVDLAVTHGSPPDKAAKSVAEQGSVVRVQVYAGKRNSASSCTKLAPGGGL